jgi:hypothetical protein
VGDGWMHLSAWVDQIQTMIVAILIAIVDTIVASTITVHYSLYHYIIIWHYSALTLSYILTISIKTYKNMKGHDRGPLQLKTLPLDDDFATMVGSQSPRMG